MDTAELTVAVTADRQQNVTITAEMDTAKLTVAVTADRQQHIQYCKPLPAHNRKIPVTKAQRGHYAPAEADILLPLNTSVADPGQVDADPRVLNPSHYKIFLPSVL